MIYRPKNKILALLVQASEFILAAFDCIYFLLSGLIPRRQSDNVLIVRLDAIGDFVIWLAAAKEIRKIFAGRRLTLLGNELWTDLAKELHWFDAVWSLNRKKFLMNPFYRLKMLGKIQSGGFSISLHTVFNRDFFVGDVSVKASRASRRIGFSGSTENIKPRNKRISDGWYTELVTSGQKHQLDQDADFVRALGANYEPSLPSLPRLPLPREFPVKDYYIVIPGAGHEMRQWPVERFQEIARRTFVRTGLTCVLCGGKRELDIGRAFSRDLSCIPVLDMVGRTSLLYLVSIIAHARFVIGNDTGAIHIAVATSTPSVCILGGAHPGRYVPYPPALNAQMKTVMHPMDCFHCDWHCTRNPDGVVPCIDAIPVDDVWKAVEESIAKE